MLTPQSPSPQDGAEGRGRNTITRFGRVESSSRLEDITEMWVQAGDGADGRFKDRQRSI